LFSISGNIGNIQPSGSSFNNFQMNLNPGNIGVQVKASFYNPNQQPFNSPYQPATQQANNNYNNFNQPYLNPTNQNYQRSQINQPTNFNNYQPSKIN